MDKRLMSLMLFLLLGLGANAARGDLTDGLVALWKFEGNFNDSAGTNHGTPKGDAKIVTDAERGQVLELDGTGDYVEIPNSPSLNITGNQITLAAWVYHDDVTGNPEIIIAKVFNNTTHSSPYFSYGLHILNPSGSPRVWISRTGGSSNANNAATVLTSKKWHHLAGVYDGAQLRLFLDGKQVASSNVTGNIIGYDTVLRLGINGGLTEPMDGKMDDVCIFNRALSAEEIVAIMQRIGANPGLAVTPNPAVAAKDVPADTTLSWTPGKFAAAHDVYFGTAFADVNTAARANTLGVLVSQGQAETTYQLAAPLDYGQTYYWRVDEVNKAPDSTIFKGDMWSFTVEPYAYPIQGVTATASSAQTGAGPEKTVDGSGLNAGDQHGTELSTMWLSAGASPNWIQFAFDQAYKVSEMWVWNSNQIIEPVIGFGAKSVKVEYSVDGTTWTEVTDVPEFGRGTGLDTYTANTIVSLGGVLAKYVKLTIVGQWGVAPQCSLSEVRFLSVPVQARQPQPATAATGVSVEAVLSWRPGRGAASHNVFLGTDRTAVAEGTAAATTTADHGLSPDCLTYGTTYYWRVDEVNAVTYPGEVWSFTTQPYGVVDDFESYTDKAGAEVFTIWVDGFDNPTKNGAVVGYANAANGTFSETTTVYGGKQSMPFAYDNSKAPLSEATRTFEEAQDWSRHGLTTLVLFFRGDPANAGAPIYVKINGTKALYNNGAVGTTLPLWKQWNIDLTSLSVNLKSVKTLTIGVGDGTASGSGTLLFDEIRLYAAPPQLIAAPTDPGQTGLAASWAFEEDFKDSAGTNHGTAKGDAKIVTDAQRGKVLQLDGVGDYVEVPNSPSLNLTGDKVSMAAWVNFDSVATVQIIIAKVVSDTTHVSPYFSYGLHTLANGQPRVWIARTGGTSYLAGTAGMLKAQTWYHLAGVYDGARLRLYVDGSLVGNANAAGNLAGYDTALRLGANGVLTELMAGKLDDVRIYNRPLSEGEIRYLAGDR